MGIIIGNFVVLRVYFHNKCLQVSKHFYILSLAIADLTIGLFPLNLFTGYVMSGKWPFGGKLCSAWLSIDHILFTVSNVSVVAIALDRYLCICHPVYYQNNRLNNRKSSTCAVLLSWAVSVLIWAPAIIIYPRVNAVKFDPYRCKIIFYQHDVPLTVFVVTFSFFVPVLILVCFYTAVFRKISFGFRTTTPSSSKVTASVETSVAAITEAETKSLHRRKSINTSGSNIVSPIVSSCRGDVLQSSKSTKDNFGLAISPKLTTKNVGITTAYTNSTPIELPVPSIQVSSISEAVSEISIIENASTISSTPTMTNKNKRRNKLKTKPKKKRASRLLLLVTVAFTLCWLPYHVAVLIEAGTDYSFSDGLWHLCYVVGKFNSLLNPFCYAVGHPKFRKGFKNTFLCFFNNRDE